MQEKNLLQCNAFLTQIVTPPPFSRGASEPVSLSAFSGPHSGSDQSSTWCVLSQGKVFRSAYTVWRQAPARMHSVPDHWAIHSPENTGTWRFRSKPSPASRSCSPTAGSHTLNRSWHISVSPVFGFLFVLFRSVPEWVWSWANGSFLCYCCEQPLMSSRITPSLIGDLKGCSGTIFKRFFEKFFCIHITA